MSATIMEIDKEAYNRMVENISSMSTEEFLTQGLVSIVDIPEDIIDTHKWVDEHMDSQPDEPILDQYIECIATKEPAVMPSCKSIDEWLLTQNDINECIRTGYADYIKDYRKELREWYKKNKHSFPALNYIEIDDTLINIDESCTTNVKINSAIKNSINARHE